MQQHPQASMIEIDFCLFLTHSLEMVEILKKLVTIQYCSVQSINSCHVDNEQYYQNGAIVNDNELYSLFILIEYKHEW